MGLNLIKLCVGCDTPQDLTAWRSLRRAQGFPVSIVHTRQTPKRVEELLAGGSLYWVFKGVVLARQVIDAIDTLDEGGRRRCEITLRELLIATAPQPRRAFQGWRYLDDKDAPADLPSGEGGETMPQALAKELRELGVW